MSLLLRCLILLSFTSCAAASEYDIPEAHILLDGTSFSFTFSNAPHGSSSRQGVICVDKS